MDSDAIEENAGKIIAIDMLLRGLFTKWALEADDPRGSNFRMMEGMVVSMIEAAKPQTDLEHRLIGYAESFIKRMQDSIDFRLEGLGHNQ